jgi:hypothetical protein
VFYEFRWPAHAESKNLKLSGYQFFTGMTANTGHDTLDRPQNFWSAQALILKAALNHASPVLLNGTVLFRTVNHFPRSRTSVIAIIDATTLTA